MTNEDTLKQLKESRKNVSKILKYRRRQSASRLGALGQQTDEKKWELQESLEAELKQSEQSFEVAAKSLALYSKMNVQTMKDLTPRSSSSGASIKPFSFKNKRPKIQIRPETNHGAFPPKLKISREPSPRSTFSGQTPRSTFTSANSSPATTPRNSDFIQNLEKKIKRLESKLSSSNDEVDFLRGELSKVQDSYQKSLDDFSSLKQSLSDPELNFIQNISRAETLNRKQSRQLIAKQQHIYSMRDKLQDLEKKKSQPLTTKFGLSSNPTNNTSSELQTVNKKLSLKLAKIAEENEQLKLDNSILKAKESISNVPYIVYIYKKDTQEENTPRKLRGGWASAYENSGVTQKPLNHNHYLKLASDLKLNPSVPPDCWTGDIAIVALDIEESEYLWHKKPDLMRHEMFKLSRQVHYLIQKYHGQILQHAADCYVIAFQHNVLAVSFALKLQMELLVIDWDPKLLKLSDVTNQELDESGATLFWNGFRIKCAIHSGTAVSKFHTSTSEENKDEDDEDDEEDSDIDDIPAIQKTVPKIEPFGATLIQIAKTLVTEYTQGGDILMTNAVWDDLHTYLQLPSSSKTGTLEYNGTNLPYPVQISQASSAIEVQGHSCRLLRILPSTLSNHRLFLTIRDYHQTVTKPQSSFQDRSIARSRSLQSRLQSHVSKPRNKFSLLSKSFRSHEIIQQKLERQIEKQNKVIQDLNATIHSLKEDCQHFENLYETEKEKHATMCRQLALDASVSEINTSKLNPDALSTLHIKSLKRELQNAKSEISILKAKVNQSKSASHSSLLNF